MYTELLFRQFLVRAICYSSHVRSIFMVFCGVVAAWVSFSYGLPWFGLVGLGVAGVGLARLARAGLP